MSELGNMMRSLRGEATLEEFSEKTGTSLSTLCNIEEGQHVRLRTLEGILERVRMNVAERAEYAAAWARGQLGDWGSRVQVVAGSGERGAGSRKGSGGPSIESRLLVKLRDLPRADQLEVLKAMERPEILKSLAHLNDFHEAVESNRTHRTGELRIKN